MSSYQKKGSEAVMECYKRMYKESKPPIDFDKILKSGEGKQPEFFMKYFLSQERQDEIIEEVCKDMKIKLVRLKRDIRTEVILGSSPTGSEEAWKRHRKLESEDKE